MKLSPYLKAVIGAIVAGLTTAGTSAIDNSISLQEGIYIALAFFIALGAVYATPNRP